MKRGGPDQAKAEPGGGRQVPVIHRYGDDPAQFGELRQPEGTTAGTVVVIHGGFWRARYDLSLGRPLAADPAARGYAAWNLEYRRAGAAGGWPGTFANSASKISSSGQPVRIGTTIKHSPSTVSSMRRQATCGAGLSLDRTTSTGGYAVHRGDEDDETS
jgi:hypothetical protein